MSHTFPPPPRRSLSRRLLLTASLATAGVSFARTATPATTAPATTAPVTTAPVTTESAVTAAGDLTLQAALDRLEQSPSVAQAKLSVQVAQTNLNASKAALGLSVSVTGNTSYTGGYSATAADGTPTTVAGDWSGSAGVNASLGILPWSSNQTGLRAAQRSLTLAEANLLVAQNSARLNVVQQYLNAVVASQDIALADQTLTLRQRQRIIAQTQKDNGNATDSDVLSAQAAVQTAQAAQLQASASLEAARRSLSAALGSDIGNVTFSTPPSEAFTLPEVNTLVARARASRTEVIKAQNDLADAQDNLDELRRNATLPDLTASVRYGPASSGGLNASLNLRQGTLGAGYSVPLFNGSDSASGTNRFVASVSGSYVVYSPAQKAQISAAQANVTQAQLTQSVAQQTVELDVRTKYSAAQTSLIGLQTAQTQVQVAQLAVTTAQTRLQAGTATQDDVVSAELNLGQAQRNLLQARATAQLNVIQLLNAAGGTQ